jgi:hypothetical protein
VSARTSHEVVVRPNGRLYRARKQPRAEILGGDWDDLSVIVWRTHDIDVATALAGEAWRRETGGEPLPGDVFVSWFRYFPWDPGGCYDWAVIEVSHDEHGATPGVMFRWP